MDNSSRKPSPESTKRGDHDHEGQADSARTNNSAIPNLAKHHRAANGEHDSLSILKKALSKTEPLPLNETEVLKEVPRPQESIPVIQDSLIANQDTHQRQSISPNSASKKSNFRPDNHSESGNSSMEAEIGTPRKRASNPLVNVRRNAEERKQEPRPSTNVVLPQSQDDEEESQEEGEKKLGVISDRPNLKEKLRKKSKIPPRRLQSILKKSQTNKNSRDTSPSRDSKRVQFNRYKQVLTFYMDKAN